MYDLPEEIEVCADGPLRIITLNRPEALNAVNDALHTGLARQAVESTKRLLNIHLERAVLATLDFATTAEDQSFQTEDFRSTIAKLTEGKT